jgi:hypothetical protein
MTSTPDSILIGVELQGLGDNTNTWGYQRLNNALTVLAKAGHGYESIAVTGNATISDTNYSTTNQSENRVIKFTGSLAAAATLTFPSRERLQLFWNATGQSVTVKCSGGTGVTIPNGRIALLFCDGVDFYNGIPTHVGTSFSPSLGGDVANVDYVDTAIANATIPASAGTVLVSGGDTTAGYLVQKVDAGAGIEISQTSPGGDEGLSVALDGDTLTTLLSVGGEITQTIANTTTQLSTYTTNIITGTGPAILPTFAADGEFVIVDFRTTAGVTSTVGRNSQTIDGSATDDTYIGDGGTGPVIRYSYSSAGAVISRLIGGSPV